MKNWFFLFGALLTLTVTAQNKTGFKGWAVVPPMGWNSYDAYCGSITEKQFRQEVDVLAVKLLPHGYEYAVIDFCWFNPGPEGWSPDNWTTFEVNQPYKDYGSRFQGLAMDEYGRLLPAINRFPSAADGKGFKAIGDYVHSKGMKLGIHVMRGIPREAVQKNLPVLGTKYHAKDIAGIIDSCIWNESMWGVDATKPGAQEYYNSVLNLYAGWGVDFIKVDDIAAPVYHRGEIELIRKAIDQCKRKIVLSLSPGETLLGDANHVDNHVNMYRISNDFWDNWPGILRNFDLLNSWSPFIGNGSWPDADMIPTGKLCLKGFPEAQGRPNSDKREHNSFLSFTEQQTMLTLWCMARSPLIWGGSPAQSDDSTYMILGNDELLHINKSSINNHQLYLPGWGRGDNRDTRIWVAESPDKKIKYVALFNLKQQPAEISFRLSWEFWKGKFRATELWTRQDKEIVDGEIKATVIPHGVAVFKLTGL
ncbi:MAG: glycoside hydrolase family 27 protein [Bacteroidota bacterium]|nr:glycoside hydrolase family 27 protein [Bacteroidota bacterium]